MLQSCVKIREKKLGYATNLYGWPMVVKEGGAQFTNMNQTLLPVILKTSPVFPKQSLERSRRRNSSLTPRGNLSLRSLMDTLIVLGLVEVTVNKPQSLGLEALMEQGYSPFEVTNRYLALHEAQPRMHMDLVLPVEKQTTSDDTVPISTETTNLTSPRRSENVQITLENPTEKPDDFRDEYLSCSIFRSVNFDNDRFTDDYFVYEQGQKDIIVRHRLRDHIEFWRRIESSKFIVDTIINGYKIPFYSIPPRTISKNNMSALKESSFVTAAIQDLLDKSLIEKCSYLPKVVNPLSVSIQNNGKKRLILDLRNVNLHVWKQSIKYEDLRLALLYLEQDSWMIKFDIHSAYHFIDIFYEHTEFLGFSFPDINGNICYYKFLVLPFGLGVAPYLYTKFTRPLIKKWRGEGKKVILFLDDGFGTAGSLEQTVQLASEIKRDLLDSGLIPKIDKSIWVPVQEIEWLGAFLDTKEFKISIPQRRINKAMLTINEIKRKSWVPVRAVASFIGQIISMSIVIGPVSQIMTRYLSIDVLQANNWSSYIKLSDFSIQQLSFWETTLVSLNVKHLHNSRVCSKIVYSDASGSAYGG